MIKVSTAKRFIVFTVAIVGLTLIFSAGKVWAKSEVAPKMKKMAKQFEKVYKIHPDIGIPATVAIFPFRCDKKLAKKGGGIAVAEMLTYHLIKTGSFKVVERMALEKIFEEQKLSLTGAIESKTAIKVGKLLGARLLVLGTVNRMGKSYQISARLVDAQTSEVIISDLIEVGIKVFEQEASPYLMLVPERQAIGLYFIGGGSPPVEPQSFPPMTFAGTYEGVSYSVTVEPKPTDIGEFSYGLGARYFPLRWLMADVAYMFSSLVATESHAEEHGGSIAYIEAEEYYNGGKDIILSLQGSALTGSLNGVLNLSASFRSFIGLGLDFHFLKYKVSSYGGLSQTFYDTTGNYVELREYIIPEEGEQLQWEQSVSFKENISIPFIRLGVEWRPQPRIGLGLSGKYILSEGDTEPVRLYVEGHYGKEYYYQEKIEFSPSEMEIFNLRPPLWSLGFTTSLYF